MHPPFFCGENLCLLDEAWRAHRSVAALEFVHATCGVDKFLFSGEEGVAGGADADLDVFAGGPCAVGCPTGTKDDRLAVVGMNIRLHS